VKEAARMNDTGNSGAGEDARLEFAGVSVSYDGAPILDGVSFHVPHGARVAVVGPNGAGKSTLFKVLVGLLPLREGVIRVHGRPLGRHRDLVAYVPQREEVDWRFPVSVMDVVLMGRFGRRGWVGGPDRIDREAALRGLTRMGIEPLSDTPVGELSGGQQQRVFLARALAQDPHILLLDEPFTGVDAPTQETTLAMLDGLRDKGVTVLVSTHDLNMAAGRFEQVVLLNRRLIASGSPAEVFSRENIMTAFGARVLFFEGSAVVDECCPPGETGLHSHEGIREKMRKQGRRW
jgi:ABC-type Mn2+/Zn2+ transport system ATPase subunit